jgi:PAS domain S-box-containing protein
MRDACASPQRLLEQLAKTRAAALAVSSVEGSDVYAQLAQRLADILGVSATLIGTSIESSPGRIHARATWLDGRLLRSFEYDVEHSPCRGVVGRESRFVASGVNHEFEPGTLFHAQGFDSYAARSLIDGTGRQLGLIVAMDRKPMPDQEVTEALMQIFAVRAAAELERERAQTTLHASEASYRSIFEASEDAIFVHDWDTGAILDVSPKATDLYGHPREQLQRLRVADLSANVHPYTEPEAARLIQRAKVHAAPVRFEWRARHRDGHLMWHDVTLKRAEIAGQPRVLAFVRDITERKAATEALRLREEQYRGIFDASADAIVLWDANLRIVDVNPAFLRIYGFEREQILGSSYPDHLPRDYVEERVGFVRRALAGEPCEAHTRAYRADGSEFQVELRVLPIRYRGEPHVLAIARDITERREAEERLRASEARYRLLFETEGDAIVLVDADSLRLIDANQAAAKMYGYPRDELLGLTALDLSTEPDGTRASIQHDEGTLSVPLRIHRRKDGSTFPVEINANRLVLDGRKTVVAAIRDISERREREEALRRSEAQLRATVETAMDAVVGMDGDGRIIGFNAAAERCFGYRREQVLGRPLGEMIVPLRHRTAHAAGMEHHRRTGEGRYLGRRVETTAQRADGTEFPVELAIAEAVSGDGRIFIGFLRDITDRKRAEQALRDSEALYRGLFNASADAMVLRDADFRVVDVNPSYTTMSGYTRDETIGIDRLLTVGNDENEQWREAHQRMLVGEQMRFEFAARRKDGTPYEAEVRGMPVSWNGRPHVLYVTRDITDRKHAERALAASEEQYRGIFNASGDALVLWNAELKVVDVNPAYLRIYRRRREEVVGYGYPAHYPREYVERRQQLIRRALAGETVELQTQAYRGDGKLFEVEWSVVPVRHRGQPHALAIARDITERKAAEAALRASEEQYRAIFNASADALILWDSQYRRVDVNRAFERTYGWSRDEVIGRSFEHHYDRPENVAPRRELVRKALAGEACQAELEAIRKDGSTILTEVHAIPFRHRGEPHVLAIARDITERKHVEERLRASEEQYRAIFNASADALVLRDAQFRIVDVNATYETMSGYSRAEVIGVDRVLANPPAFEPQIRQLHQRALAGEPIAIETPLIRRDGTRYELELRGVPIQHRGAPHVLYLGRDITASRQAQRQQRELEAQLLQAQKMEAIGQLTGGIAHDFNNILASIMGYGALALERPVVDSDPRLAEHLEQVQQACRRARDLIRQMLTFSRGRRGDPRPLALAPLVDESVQLLRSTLPGTTELQVEPIDGSLLVEADPVQMQQVLLNLCINARDAVAGRGRIAIEVRRRVLEPVGCASCGRPIRGRFVELAVADNGPGIAPEARRHIFEPFFSTKAPGKGSGMGLATVHGIVHEHGGHLLLDSHTGRGTRFAVLLPERAAAAESAGATAAAQPGTAPQAVPLRGRVLLVDDEASVLGFMQELLHSWGLEVLALRDPVEAFDRFAREGGRFDLVLTDQTMPTMTGLELARQVHATRGDVPVMLYSGFAEAIDAEQIAQAGVCKVLRKPVEPVELKDALRQCLAARPAAGS